MSRTDLVREGATENSKYVQAAGSYIAGSKRTTTSQSTGARQNLHSLGTVLATEERERDRVSIWIGVGRYSVALKCDC